MNSASANRATSRIGTSGMEGPLGLGAARRVMGFGIISPRIGAGNASRRRRSDHLCRAMGIWCSTTTGRVRRIGPRRRCAHDAPRLAYVVRRTHYGVVCTRIGNAGTGLPCHWDAHRDGAGDPGRLFRALWRDGQVFGDGCPDTGRASAQSVAPASAGAGWEADSMQRVSRLTAIALGIYAGIHLGWWLR